MLNIFKYATSAPKREFAISDILYFTSIEDTGKVWALAVQPIEYSISLDEIEREMGEDFYRCHPKYLINVAMIKDIDTLHFEAVMHEKVRCPIEQSKYLGLLSVIGKRAERFMQ